MTSIYGLRKRKNVRVKEAQKKAFEKFKGFYRIGFDLG